MFHGFEEEGRAVAKGQLEGVVVEGFEAGLGEVGNVAVDVVRGTDDVEEFVGIFGAKSGGKDALVGANEGFSSERGAVGPTSFGAEVKSPDKAVVGDGPSGGDARYGIGAGGALGNEAFEEGR